MKHKRNLDWLLDIPPGWAVLYTSLIANLERLNPDVQVDQAKQKFGELRVYLARGSEETYDLIDAATRTSRIICERCGEEARLRKSKGGYCSTLCDAHADGSKPTEDEPIVASFRPSGGKLHPRKR
jgi:hypothetical protein